MLGKYDRENDTIIFKNPIPLRVLLKWRHNAVENVTYDNIGIVRYMLYEQSSTSFKKSMMTVSPGDLCECNASETVISFDHRQLMEC